MHISAQTTSTVTPQLAPTGFAPSSPRTLHTRHGSLSAPDPLNVHAVNSAAARVAASRLSIITVPKADRTLENVIDGIGSSPTRATSSRTGNIHTGFRTFGHGSENAFSRQRSNSANSHRDRSMSPARLSFAHASFSLQTNGDSPFPPSNVHRRRTSSTSSLYHPGRPRLTANQVYELATATCDPSTQSIGKDAGGVHELPAGEFLPFVDRPVEVSALLMEGKGARLMQMILQLLPSGTGGEMFCML